jgi:hypothetical protein
VEPGNHPLREWARDTLNRDHPYLRAAEHGPDAAGRLLRAGRVALFLDGLDEMPEDFRGQALDRLREEAAGLWAVITSRTGQYREAISTGQLDNAAVIALRPVRARAAADYLLHDQPGPQHARWQQVCAYLSEHPHSVPARTLNTPLTLSLARETYRHDDPTALIDPSRYPTDQQLRADLLARVLLAAYPDQPAREHATRWLSWIAAHMGQSRDLAWWQIPTWTPQWQIKLAVGLVVGLVSGLVSGLVVGLVSGLAIASDIGYEPRTLEPRWPRPHDARAILTSGFGFGFGFGLGLVGGLAGALLFGLAVGLAVGLAGGLGLVGWLGFVLVGWLGFGLVGGLVGGLAGGSAAWLRLAEVVLAFRRQGRVRFMRVCEDALDRQVLRQAGAVYQFRHAELQDHLAAIHRQRGHRGGE